MNLLWPLALFHVVDLHLTIEEDVQLAGLHLVVQKGVHLIVLDRVHLICRHLVA